MALLSWRPAVGRQLLPSPGSSAVFIAGSAETCWDVACENSIRTVGHFVVMDVGGSAACRPSCPLATLDGAD